jgi:hypothetical protein
MKMEMARSKNLYRLIPLLLGAPLLQRLDPARAALSIRMDRADFPQMRSFASTAVLRVYHEI